MEVCSDFIPMLRESQSHKFHRAIYVDGEMAAAQKGSSADPKPCAGNDGTTVTVRRPTNVRLLPHVVSICVFSGREFVLQRTCAPVRTPEFV